MESSYQTITSKQVTLVLTEAEAKLLFDLVGECSISTFLDLGFERSAAGRINSMTEDLYDELSKVLYGKE